jgi:hypothetical protein
VIFKSLHYLVTSGPNYYQFINKRPRTSALHIFVKCSVRLNHIQSAIVRLWMGKADSVYNHKKQDVREDVYLKTETFYDNLKNGRHTSFRCGVFYFTVFVVVPDILTRSLRNINVFHGHTLRSQTDVCAVECS